MTTLQVLILVQLGGTLLLVVPFEFLNRRAGPRLYFRSWSLAWVAAFLSLFVLILRYNVLPHVWGRPLEDGEAAVRVAQIIYQTGKFTFLGLLLVGSIQHEGRGVSSRAYALGVAAIALLAPISVLLSTRVEQVVFWQCWVAIPVFAATGYRLLAAPLARRGVGATISGLASCILAGIGLLYLLAFWYAERATGNASTHYALLTGYNALGMVVLGYGMAFMLLEDTQREAAAARAEREELQARLAHSQKMEAVGQVVSGVAHELNNPLAAILNFSEILLHEPRLDEDESALKTIRDQARRCRSIVRNLLGFVRETDPRREAVALLELVGRVARVFEPEFAARSIRLDVRVPVEFPLIEADPERLEQVLINLMSNAIHATNRFGTVSVEARETRQSVEIVVEDTGTGIPSDTLPHIFEPFFSSKAAGQGTGLGLTVSLAIIQQHDGTITATNREPPTRGARFTVSLPRASRMTGQLPPSEVDSDIGSLAGLTGLAGDEATERRRRLLILDDEATVRSALRRFFERQGWMVDEGGDGATGLAKLLTPEADSGPDVVISDLKMPGMSGIELQDWLDQNRPALLQRFVFVTGDIASPAAAAFAARTGQPVLEKPFDLVVLLGAVKHLLAVP